MNKNAELIERAIQKGWLELGFYQHKNIKIRNDYWNACIENNKCFIISYEKNE